MSNFDEEFSFVDFYNDYSYDGDSDISIKEVDNKDFIFPTDFELAFLNAELSEVLPKLNTHNLIELINTPCEVQSMVNLLHKDHDEDYSIAETDDDDDNVDDDDNGDDYDNKSNILMPGLQYRIYGDDSSSDDNRSATGSIPILINHFGHVDNDDNGNDDNFFDIPSVNKDRKATVHEENKQFQQCGS